MRRTGLISDNAKAAAVKALNDTLDHVNAVKSGEEQVELGTITLRINPSDDASVTASASLRVRVSKTVSF